jgi:excinuclease UvrABC nuclease subunit
LFQIKRCSAPCVNRIDAAGYRELVEEAEIFLRGKSQAVQNQLKVEMTRASEALDFEAAAKLRDRLKAMSHIQSSQGVNPTTFEEADLFAVYSEGGQTCIQVFFFRAGQNWGNRPFFPRHDRDLPLAEVLESFVGQFYDERTAPKLILASEVLAGRALLAEALALRTEHKVEISTPSSWAAVWPRTAPRPSCWKVWRMFSAWTSRRAASRSMTIPTSRARTRSALSLLPDRKASRKRNTASSTSRARTSRPATITP